MEQRTEPKWYHYHRTAGTTLAGPWLGAWLVAAVILQTMSLTRSLQVAVSLLPLPFFLVFLWRFTQHMRKADELQRRIQLEALAIAFPMTAAMLMTVGLLQTAGIAPTGGWSLTQMCFYAGALYLLGRVIARRRYS